MVNQKFLADLIIRSGDFSLKYRMELVSGYIRGGFPIMQRKIPYFHIFQFNRRNLSVYLGYFQCYSLIKRNFSIYFSDRVPNLIPQPIRRDPRARHRDLKYIKKFPQETYSQFSYPIAVKQLPVNKP